LYVKTSLITRCGQHTFKIALIASESNPEIKNLDGQLDVGRNSGGVKRGQVFRTFAVYKGKNLGQGKERSPEKKKERFQVIQELRYL